MEKIEITKRALVQRINRKLQGRKLFIARGAKERASFGHYYVATTRASGIELHERDLNLEKYARTIGVLETWEVLSDPSS